MEGPGAGLGWNHALTPGTGLLEKFEFSISADLLIGAQCLHPLPLLKRLPAADKAEAGVSGSGRGSGCILAQPCPSVGYSP